MRRSRLFGVAFGTIVGAVVAVGAALLLFRGSAPAGGRLPPEARATRLVVDKSERTLRVFDGDRLLTSYAIALGRNPVGHKEREGDGRTPEGEYVIDSRKEDSAFHRALHVSYPGPDDAARARERGVSPGGDIMIHGLRNGLGFIGRAHLLADWTEGCIAVTDPEIEELWRAVPDGTPILIEP